MHTRVRDVLSSVVYVASATAHAIWRPQPGVRVLMYHRVRDCFQYDQLSVRVADFANQMAYLARMRDRVVSFGEVCAFLHEGRELPEGAVAITFDDGYRDNYVNALPLLRQYRLPATIFLTADYIGTGKSFHRYPEEPRAFLSWEQVGEMTQYGVTFGSHACSHAKLGELSLTDVQRELADSRRAIEDRTGGKVDVLCYPSGSFNEDVRTAAAEAGYRAAFTVRPGRVRRIDDPYTLCRTEIAGQDSIFDFRKKLAGAYDPLHRALHRLSSRRSS